MYEEVSKKPHEEHNHQEKLGVNSAKDCLKNDLDDCLYDKKLKLAY